MQNSTEKHVSSGIYSILNDRWISEPKNVKFKIDDDEITEKAKNYHKQEERKKPNQISGGEKQRVAIARALINDPLILMGDEPTGNLDKMNSEIVFNIFKELAEVYNQSLLIVTHDSDFAARTHRTIEMEDGKILNLGYPF